MLSSGSEVEFILFPAITQDQLRAYAQASGDFNPIHLDERVALSVGLPGVIAHGMLIAGLMAERALRFVEGRPDLKNWNLKRFQTRFKLMTRLGDIPSVGGTVKEYSNDKLVLELSARNQRAEVSTIALAEFSRVQDKQ